MSKLKIFALASIVMCLLTTSVAPTVSAAFQCDHMNRPGFKLSNLSPPEQAQAALCPISDDKDKTVPEIIGIIVGVLSWIIGIASVIVILVQGLRLILSGGNSQTASEARNGIIYALVGLLVALSANILVHYILDQL